MPGAQSPRDATPLVGRDRELAILHERLDAAFAGHGSLVLMSGEAGIGKTALAEALITEANARGARTLVGRCYDMADAPPYCLWVELFRGFQAVTDPPLPAAFARRGTVMPVASRVMLFEQVLDVLTRAVIARPLIIVLDDLHWADPASFDLLRFLARHLGSLPIVVIATYRTDEVDTGPLELFLPTIAHEARPQRLALARLSSDAIEALVEARYALDADEELRLVAHLSGSAEGNPFYLIEILRALEGEGVLSVCANRWRLGDLSGVRVPPLVRMVIGRRLMRLGEDLLQLLMIAAAIGQEISLSLWQDVAQVDEATLLVALDRAVAARFIEEARDASHTRFVHALVRETLYDRLPSSQRRRIHRRIAELLASESDPDPDAVASHFHRAADPRAVAWLLQSGERAQQSWAWLTAAERYEAALGLLAQESGSERARLLYLIAVLRRFADPRAAVARLDEAIRIATQIGDPVLAACARWQRGFVHVSLTSIRLGMRDIDTAGAILDALTPDDAARVRQLDINGSDLGQRDRWGGKAALLALTGRLEEAQALAERLGLASLDLPERDVRESAPAVRALGIAYAGLGSPEAASGIFLRRFAVDRAAGDHPTSILDLIDELEYVHLPYEADRIASRRMLLAEADEASRRDTESRTVLGVDFRLSRLVHLLVQPLEGAWDDADRLARHLRETQGLASIKRIAIRVTGALAYQRGEVERGWECVRELLPDGPATRPGDANLLDAQRGQHVAIGLAMDAGAVTIARIWLEANDRWLAWSGSVPGRSEGRAWWARYYRAIGATEKASDMAQQALADAMAPRQPLALLAAHRLLGELATDAGQDAEAIDHLNAALALADACAAPYERALTLLAMAAASLVSSDSVHARPLLDEARAIFTSLGAAPAHTRADALLARLDGARSRPADFPDSLSAREVDVLRLIARGMSNREIAGALFISSRTVNRHTENLYRKIGARNKAEATAYALRHDLT